MDNLRDRLADLLNTSGLTDRPPDVRSTLPERVQPVERVRPVEPCDVRPRLRPHAVCEHQWESRNGVKRCGLCHEPAPRELSPSATAEPKREGRAARSLTLAQRHVEARERAARLGHSLRPWSRRPNDAYGRWNAYCQRCWKLAVVCETAPPNLALVYGEALMHACGKRE